MGYPQTRPSRYSLIVSIIINKSLPCSILCSPLWSWLWSSRYSSLISSLSQMMMMMGDININSYSVENAVKNPIWIITWQYDLYIIMIFIKWFNHSTNKNLWIDMSISLSIVMSHSFVLLLFRKIYNQNWSCNIDKCYKFSHSEFLISFRF